MKLASSETLTFSQMWTYILWIEGLGIYGLMFVEFKRYLYLLTWNLVGL